MMNTGTNVDILFHRSDIFRQTEKQSKYVWHTHHTHTSVS